MWRDGAFDLLATFHPFDDLRTPLSYGSRFDRDLEIVGGLAGGGLPATTMRVAARRDRLGLCHRGIRSGRVQVTSFEGGEGEWTEAFEGERCEDLAGSGGHWLAAVRETDGSIVGRVLDDRGATVGERIPMGEATDALGRAIGITGTAAGFAWVEWPDRGRQLRIRSLDPGTGEVRTLVLDDEVLFGSIPAIVPWPFDPEMLALAFHGPGGVQVVVVDPVRGERLRTESLAFSMGGDVTPALVPMEGGLVVAMANYGDFDPTEGSVVVTVVGSDGSVGPLLMTRTRRGWDLGRGGISAATDGEVIVVHWAAVIDEPGDPATPGTQALTYRCD